MEVGTMTNQRENMRRRKQHGTGIEWRELHFDTTLTQGQAVAVLERFATARELGVIAIELHADEKHLRWLIGVEPHRINALKQVLATSLPVRVVKPR